MGKVAMKSKAVTKGHPAQKRKGHVYQRGMRGAGTKYKMETFATVSNFTPGTRIKYGPNPKRPGSKSFDRYASFMKAKTVGEALKLGATKGDLFWEYERGDYKVLGTARTEAQEVAAIGQKAYDDAANALSSFVVPRGLAMKSLDDPRAVEQLKQEEAWRDEKLKKCEAIAKKLGMTVESSEEIEATGESTEIRLQRRVADAIAAQKLRDATKAGKKITDADVSEVLSCWGFSENHGRLNVLPEGRKYVYSDTIGAIRRRTGEFGITPPTKKYPDFVRIFNQWLSDNKPKIPCKFLCTAINLNANYAGRRHRDANNEGPSVIRAFGKFKGGRLCYWPNDNVKPKPKVDVLKKEDCVKYDLSKNTIAFNGNNAHEVEPFTGERYSVVFFTSGGYKKASAATTRELKKVGFPWPTPAELGKLKRACPA